MKRYAFILALALMMVPVVSAQTPRKRNILIIHTDQQRVDTMKAYGNARIRTPNLDALAERSFVFDSFYVGQPVCTPSRGTLWTGLYPHTHGSWENNIPLNPKIPVMNQMIKDSDYVSAYFGKWHLGDELSGQNRFTEFDSTELYGLKQSGSKRTGYYRFLVEHGIAADTPAGHSRDLANRLPKELSKPAYLAKVGSEFIERHRAKPFVLYLSFLEPHAFADHDAAPFKNVNDDLYRPEDMEVPETFFEDMDPSVSYQKRMWRVSLQRGEFPIAYPQTVAEFKHAKARYWGLITLVDEMVGRVLERLRALGLEDNTIVVFTSDHGEMMGDHRLMSKTVTYEESIKVPLLISVPGMRRSVRVTSPAAQVDIVPTLLDLIGQARPPHLQGESWAPSMRGEKQWGGRDVIIESNFRGYSPGGDRVWADQHVYYHRTVVTPERWKLSLSDVGEGELYDLNKDPKERRNLFYDSGHKSKGAELRERIRRWQKSTADPVDLDNVNAAWPAARRGKKE